MTWVRRFSASSYSGSRKPILTKVLLTEAFQLSGWAQRVWDSQCIHVRGEISMHLNFQAKFSSCFISRVRLQVIHLYRGKALLRQAAVPACSYLLPHSLPCLSRLWPAWLETRCSLQSVPQRQEETCKHPTLGRGAQPGALGSSSLSPIPWPGY